MTALRLVALLLLLGCGGTKKTTIPVDSPLRPFVPPEEPPAETPPEGAAPSTQPASQGQ